MDLSDSHRSPASQQEVANLSQTLPLGPSSAPHLPVSSHNAESDLGGPSNSSKPGQTTAPDKGPEHHQQNSNPVSERDGPYFQVQKYLKEFRDWQSRHNVAGSLEDYSQPFVCELPRPDWSRLCHELNLNETEDDFPRFSYDASTSTLTIQCISSPIDGFVRSFIAKHLQSLLGAMNEVLRRRLKLHYNAKEDEFVWQYAHSKKTADLALISTDDDGDQEYKLVFQISTSLPYGQVKQAMKPWLEGRHERTVVVAINITESPKYKCPLDFDITNCALLDIPGASTEIHEDDFNLQGEYGPVEYQGCCWAGRISEAYMEVWMRNRTTRLAERQGHRMPVLSPTGLTERSGNQIVLHRPTYSPQIELNSFLNLFRTDPQVTRFDWDEFRYILPEIIKELAVYRCRSWLADSKKRAGEVSEEEDSDVNTS